MPIPTIASGAAGVWLWDKFGKEIVRQLANRAWRYVTWAEAASRYRENLYKRYKEIHIFGQPEPVPLEGIFTHVRVLDEPMAFKRYNVKALQEAMIENDHSFRETSYRRVRQSIEVVQGTDLVNREGSHRLLILGKPGGGKTTFLQYLALEATKGNLRKLPIVVTLREWREIGDYESLVEFISRQFDICQFPNARPVVDHFLRQVDTLLLFDGLDEIPEEGDRRGRAIEALRDFSRKYSNPQILITCRVAATDYTFRGFKYVELADFDGHQKRAFIYKWFRKEKHLADQFWGEFQRKENENLRELSRVPLLLALLCLGYEETLSFPSRRVDLYEEALEALLKKWDSSRRIRRDEIYQKLSIGRKYQMLAQLAFGYFRDGIYFFEQREIADRIANYLSNLPPAEPDEDVDGVAVLKAIEAQHGILVEFAHRVHTFAHLTFQEYYTAKYIVDNVMKNTIPSLMNHIAEDRWREVFLLTASLLSEADLFFECFLQKLDSLVKNDDRMVQCLEWAENKANDVNTFHKPSGIRAYYLALDIARDLLSCDAVDVNRMGHDREILDSHLFLNRILIIDPKLNLAVHYAGSLDPACDLDRALYFALDLTSSRAHYRSRKALLTILDHASNCACHLGLSELAQALKELSLQIINAESEIGLSFARELQTLMVECRNIGHDWGFNEEQFKVVRQYFCATSLLVECLDVAYVTNRDDIEDRILRSPA
jgi:hypothetical protein